MNHASFHQHRLWIGLLLSGLTLLALLRPLSSFVSTHFTVETARLEQDKNRLITHIRQWETDAIAAEELAQSIEAKEIESFLAPASRGSLALRLEAMAAKSRLASFTFTLSPAEPWAGNDAFPNIKGVTQSHLSFEADAPTDGDVFAFLSALAELPGRMDLEHLNLSRTTHAETLARTNIHVKGEILWLTNQEKKRS